MGFSFTATAQCDYCGNLLGSSDEDCDHDGAPVKKHTFRRIAEGRDSLTGVKSTQSFKWHKLKEEVGDSWIGYEYLGTKESVNTMLKELNYGSVDELPKVCMSLAAPAEVEEHEV